jgi:hypothetical protein
MIEIPHPWRALSWLNTAAKLAFTEIREDWFCFAGL